MKKKPLNDCCYKNIEKAVRKGRGKYVCPKCGTDVSLMVFFVYQIIKHRK